MFSKVWYLKRNTTGKLNFLPTTKNLSIGRRSNSDIRINNNLVSKNQCEIELDGTTPILFNLS